LASPISGWCQFTVKGKVTDTNKLPLPGVDIVEEGTHNGTRSSMDGSFLISVASGNSSLVFSFVGMYTQIIALKGKDSVVVKMKEECIHDIFDFQEITLYANSGVINNPVGGMIDISSPFLFKSFKSPAILKGRLSFQSNLDRNNFINSEIELSHLIFTCDYDAGINWNYREFSVGNELNSKSYSFESDWEISNLLRLGNTGNTNTQKLILGYSRLEYYHYKTYSSNSLNGPLIGFGIFLGQPFLSPIVGKISIYKDFIEYQAYIQYSYKRFHSFIKFYKLGAFEELSLGIGISTWYNVKKHRK
jgi:hypothetical protein